MTFCDWIAGIEAYIWTQKHGWTNRRGSLNSNFDTFLFHFPISDDAFKIDKEKRDHIKQLKKQFDELVYEYVTETEDDDEKSNDCQNVITEEKLCLELHEALSLG